MVSFAGAVWVMRHQNEMITSDNLANDLHWGEEHIYWMSYTEVHSFQSHPLISLFLLFSFTMAEIYAESEMFSTQEDMQYSLS